MPAKKTGSPKNKVKTRSPEDQRLTAWLRQRMDELGLSADELARQAGYTTGTGVRVHANGTRPQSMTKTMADKIAGPLKVLPGWHVAVRAGEDPVEDEGGAGSQTLLTALLSEVGLLTARVAELSAELAAERAAGEAQRLADRQALTRLESQLAAVARKLG